MGRRFDNLPETKSGSRGKVAKIRDVSKYGDNFTRISAFLLIIRMKKIVLKDDLKFYVWVGNGLILLNFT